MSAAQTVLLSEENQEFGRARGESVRLHLGETNKLSAVLCWNGFDFIMLPELKGAASLSASELLRCL